MTKNRLHRSTALTVPLLLAGLVTLSARAAHAHSPVGAIAPGDWWRVWDFDPILLLGFAFLWAIYSRGVLNLWERAGVGHGVSRAQVGAFFGGVLVLFAALVSPVDTLSAALSSAHMAQHMLLMMVAAPLLAFGASLPVFVWALPSPVLRRRFAPLLRAGAQQYAPASRLWQPTAAWILYAATLTFWHLPALYLAALRDRAIHDAQHLCFLIAAFVFWKVLFDPVGRLRLNRGAAVLYLFGSCLFASALGIYMTLSPRVWYLDYQTTVPAWGLTPLEDQQLAGLIMWMPGCTAYAVIAALVFAAWLREPRSARALPDTLLLPPAAPEGAAG